MTYSIQFRISPLNIGVKIASIAIAFTILILLSTAAPSVLNTAHVQTNATSTNQTGKTSSTTAVQSEQASQSIRGEITITGSF